MANSNRDGWKTSYSIWASDFSQVSLSNYLTEFHIDYWTIVEAQILHFISSRQVGLLCFIQFSLAFSATWFWLIAAYMEQENLCWQSPTDLTSGWKNVQHAFTSSLEKCIWTRTKSLKMQSIDLNQQECKLHFMVSSPPYLCCALVSD